MRKSGLERQLRETPEGCRPWLEDDGPGGENAAAATVKRASGWIVGGRNALTFRRPVGVYEFCVARGVVQSKTLEGDRHMRVSCEVWVETEQGEKAIVGTCSALVER